MMNLRIIFGETLAAWGRSAVILGLLVTGLGMATPAQAQVIKPGGIPIPAFFFSGAERRAREACAQELPNCRASVRAQMEQEMAISLTFPWIILGVGILAALFYLRKQEKEKLRARTLARAHHDPGAFKKLDREKSERNAQGENDEEREDLV